MNIKSSFGLPTQFVPYCSTLSKQVLPICSCLLAFAQTAFAEQQEDKHSITSAYWPVICFTLVGLGALTLLAMRYLAILPPGILPKVPASREDPNPSPMMDNETNDGQVTEGR